MNCLISIRQRYPQLAQSDIREYVMQLRASAKVEVPSSAAPASANPAQDPATQAK